MSHIRGRFNKPADQTVTAYTASIPYDHRLYEYDIAGSIAHARMLGKQGIITSDEAKTIIGGLEAIRQEISEGRFPFKTELEDIHMNIEAGLMAKVGEVGGKLHTARSRNDQIALDMRLFTREAATATLTGIKGLMGTLLELTKANREVVLPGYTHLQPAQPILLAHHLLAYFEMFTRDHARFSDCRARADVMPLGSGALAGAAYKLDREAVARELGFREVSRNSLDAVADRDFILEFEAAAAIAMMHFSRLAEEIIIWSTEEFGFIELDETFATGSSIMPQKKNPDVAELARGKTGRVYGHLMALLTTMKALPLAYNRDLQEDKEGLFDTVDTLLATLEVFRGMLATITIRPERMAAAAGRGYLLATDLADYLVGKGEPFRSAHGIVARLVSHLISTNRTLEQLELNKYREFCPRFEADVYQISVASSLNARDIPGGTAPAQVAQALATAEKSMEELPD